MANGQSAGSGNEAPRAGGGHSRIPRHEKRNLVPFPSGSIRVEIRLPFTDTLMHGNLWDLTHDGCCVLADGQADELLNKRCQLTLRDPASSQTLQFEALLEWCDDTMRNSFCGFLFQDPPTLPPGTFLEEYLPSQG